MIILLSTEHHAGLYIDAFKLIGLGELKYFRCLVKHMHARG